MDASSSSSSLINWSHSFSLAPLLLPMLSVFMFDGHLNIVLVLLCLLLHQPQVGPLFGWLLVEWFSSFTSPFDNLFSIALSNSTLLPPFENALEEDRETVLLFFLFLLFFPGTGWANWNSIILIRMCLHWLHSVYEWPTNHSQSHLDHLDRGHWFPFFGFVLRITFSIESWAN